MPPEETIRRNLRVKAVFITLCLHVSLLTTLGTLSHAANFFFHNDDSVVFLGDSITEQRLYTTYIEAYTLTRFPHWKISFRNVGWGGDTSWLRQRHVTNEKVLFAADEQTQQRLANAAITDGLARDVFPLKPTVVTIDFGMNDHAYQGFREDIFRVYVQSQTRLVQELKQRGIRVALLTSQPIEEHYADPEKNVRNQSLRKFADGLKQVAVDQGVLFIDQFDPYMSVMLHERAANSNAFIGGGERGLSPHVACKDGVQVPGLDRRTIGQIGYQISQRIRKRVEEIIGWIKVVGGLRRSRYRGQERTQAWGYFVAGTYNLLRLARLEPASTS